MNGRSHVWRHCSTPWNMVEAASGYVDVCQQQDTSGLLRIEGKMNSAMHRGLDSGWNDIWHTAKIDMLH